jgi:hypothetical protein
MVSVSLDGAAPEFLVAILVSLEDFLDGTEDSLEGASFNTHNLGEGECLDAGLSGDVPHKGNLTEVVTVLVVIDCRDLLA